MADNLLNRLLTFLVAKKDEPLPGILEYPDSRPASDSETKTLHLDSFLKQNGTIVASSIRSVIELKPGSKGEILFILPNQNGRLERLSSLGVVAGNTITLLQKQPSLVVSVDHTEIALDKDIARGIFVRLITG